MKKIILFISLLCIYNKANAQAVTLVEDLANLPHNILSSVEAVEMVSEQIKHYKLAKEELELIIKNSAAPYFYVYNEVQNFDENMERLKDRFEKFSNPKAVDDYFKKYYDINWYRSSPCYKAGGCTDEDLNRIAKQREERLEYMKNISTNLKKDLNNWADNQKARYERLKKLNNAAQKAEGHFEIQSYQAQYLSEMTKELMDISDSMKKFNEFINTINEENIQKGMANIAQGESEWVTPKIKKFQIQYIGE